MNESDSEYYLRQITKRKKRRAFSDLDMEFRKHPGSNDVLISYDEEAIKRSLMNLIMTRKGERLFQPNVGCNVYDQLFELNTPITAINIRQSIEFVINSFEPRVQLEEVKVESTADDHGYNVTIIYYIINIPDQQTFTYFLERIR